MSKISTSFSAQLGREEASQACRDCIASSGWTLSADDPGRIIASIPGGAANHSSRVEVVLAEGDHGQTSVALNGNIGGVGPIQSRHLRSSMDKLQAAVIAVEGQAAAAPSVAAAEPAVSDSDRFCRSCGAELTRPIGNNCPSCGNSLAPNLTATPPAPAPSSTPAPPPAGSAPNPAVGVPGFGFEHYARFVIVAAAVGAIITWLFLPWFGMPQVDLTFKARQSFNGSFYVTLLAFWVPIIVGLAALAGDRFAGAWKGFFIIAAFGPAFIGIQYSFFTLPNGLQGDAGNFIDPGTRLIGPYAMLVCGLIMFLAACQLESIEEARDEAS